MEAVAELLLRPRLLFSDQLMQESDPYKKNQIRTDPKKTFKIVLHTLDIRCYSV